MRILLRVTLALLALGGVVSTSEAFWRHKCKPTVEYDAPSACGPAPCAPTVAMVPETKDVYTTRYRAEVRYVPETVVTRVTTMVPARVAPPAAAPSYGCHGSAPSLGCHGSAPSLGCQGSPSP